MKGASPPAGERLIKRYPNRKLYDPWSRRYVTLDRLARMVGAGQELMVVDQRTGEDLTAVVLAQVILDGIKERTARIPRQVLARLIRLGAAAGAGAEWPSPQQAVARAREEAERIAARFLGRLSLEDALALRHEIAGALQRGLAEAQRGLEARLKGVLARIERSFRGHPSLRAVREWVLAPGSGRSRRPAAARGAAGARRGTAARRKRRT